MDERKDANNDLRSIFFRIFESKPLQINCTACNLQNADNSREKLGENGFGFLPIRFFSELTGSLDLKLIVCNMVP